MFEAFAVKVLQASRRTQDAAKLLNLNWHQIQSIMDKAVARGLERRTADEIPWVGMDEKSFRKGYNYVSIINDLERGIELMQSNTLSSGFRK
jgi:hypothetical protein